MARRSYVGESSSQDQSKQTGKDIGFKTSPDTAQQHTELNPVSAPRIDPTGHYVIKTEEDIGPQIDTTNFTLTIFYTEVVHPEKPKSQLHAKFAFGKLIGRMRFCPVSAYPKGKKFQIEEFEKACNLEKGSLPCPERCNWLMRWRGKDGGMRLDKKVGGEENVQGVFDFKFEEDDNSVRIEFAMPYHGRVFAFSGSKIRELNDDEKATTRESIKKEWAKLGSWDWMDTGLSPRKPSFGELPMFSGAAITVEDAEKYLRNGPNKWAHLVDSSDSE